MNKILDFCHIVTEGPLFLDNSCVERDEKLMKRGNFFGFDNLINENAFFEIHSDNLRDSVISVKSKCMNRIRQLVASLALSNKMDVATSMREILSQKYSGGRILLLEHNSHFASVLSTICLQSNVDLVTAEYFGDRYKSGEILNSVLHVDIQDSHFPDNYFDLILHTDVFEHLPDAPKGEQETVRILKPGGCSVFTAPFDYAAMEDHIFAEIINGATVYHRDPIYHHDPVAPDGKCLLFRIFAFSTLQQRFNKLGCSFVCNYLHSKYMGILGNNGFCFVASKL